jgi:hypothetical protein
MNSTIKERWITALRSGKYQQMRTMLRGGDANSYCCLGVLCELYREDHDASWEPVTILDESRLGFAVPGTLPALGLPPHIVVQWAGLDDDTIEDLAFRNDGMEHYTDDAHSFAEIASVIERDL